MQQTQAETEPVINRPGRAAGCPPGWASCSPRPWWGARAEFSQVLTRICVIASEYSVNSNALRIARSQGFIRGVKILSASQDHMRKRKDSVYTSAFVFPSLVCLSDRKPSEGQPRFWEAGGGSLGSKPDCFQSLWRGHAAGTETTALAGPRTPLPERKAMKRWHLSIHTTGRISDSTWSLPPRSFDPIHVNTVFTRGEECMLSLYQKKNGQIPASLCPRKQAKDRSASKPTWKYPRLKIPS